MEHTASAMHSGRPLLEDTASICHLQSRLITYTKHIRLGVGGSSDSKASYFRLQGAIFISAQLEATTQELDASS